MSRFERALLMDKETESYPTPEMVARRQINHVGLLKRGASSPALLQRIQRDQSFLQDRKTLSKTAAAAQQTTTPVTAPAPTESSSSSTLQRQKTRQFKARSPRSPAK